MNHVLEVSQPSLKSVHYGEIGSSAFVNKREKPRKMLVLVCVLAGICSGDPFIVCTQGTNLVDALKYAIKREQENTARL